MGALVEPDEIVTRKTHVADNQAGAMQADRGRFFEGEAEGLGGGAEASCSLGRRSVPVAAEKELGASLEV